MFASVRSKLTNDGDSECGVHIWPTMMLQEFVAASMSAYQMSHGLLAGSSTSWQNRVRVVFDKIDEDGNG